MDAPPIKPFQQRRQLCRRQSHHAVFNFRPAEDAVLQPLGKQAKTRPIPEDQLDPVRTLGPEHVDPPPRTGRPSWSRALAPPVLRHLCGSRQAWSPPSPGPRPSGRSRAGFQRTQHRHQSLCVRAAADPDRHATDLDLDRTGTGLGLVPRPSPLRNRRRSRIHNCRHKLQPVSLRTSSFRFSIDVASQTIAAAIIHGVEPRHRPSLRSSRSRQQSGPCLDRAMSAAVRHR
jgi:hypothetical protein